MQLSVFLKMLPVVVLFTTAGNIAFGQPPTVVYDIGQSGIVLKEGTHTYIRDTSISDFVGTWRWQHKDSSLIFKFAKVTKNVGSDDNWIDIDFISGGYILTVKKKQLVNTMSSSPLLGNSEGRPQSLLFSLFYNPKNTHTRLLFKKLNSHSIAFTLEARTGEIFYKPDKHFPLPVNIVLSKVN